MEQLPKRRIWLPSVDMLVVLTVGVVISAIGIPGLLSSHRASNERHASTVLKTLTSAEADFRANDRDGNQVHDFWTGDVSGLYYVRSPETKLELKLIEASVATADAKPLFPVARQADFGYFFLALDWDESAKGIDRFFKVDTDNSGRKVHNESKFGFCAYPMDDGAGKYIFFVNENNTILRQAGTLPKNAFPSEEQMMSSWSKID